MISPENTRKIAFVGTSCIGKTTLFDHYQSRYKDDPTVAFVPEAARKYFTDNPTIPVAKRFGVEHQGAVQQLALRREKDAHASGAEKIVCDRSVLDAVAYVRGQGDKDGSKRLLERVELWLPTYYAILLLNPADVPYETDDVRIEDGDMRQRNHDAFLEVFMDAGISYELLKGTSTERIQRVDIILFDSN